MPRQTFDFGELLADQPALGNAGLAVADGVWPVARGYKPVAEFSAAINGTLPANALGAFSARSKAGAGFMVAGTAANIYRYQTSGWASLGSGFTASASIGWKFVQWGDLIIATNGSNPVQKLDMAAGSPVFAALGGSPPTAELIAVVRDFVVLGRIAANSQRVGWSAINDAEGWTFGVSQSGSQIMQTGGDVTGITGGEFGVILQERRVSRMTYIGAPLVFQFDELSDSIGCVARNSVVRVGAMTFFLAEQGFAMCDGNSARLIGDEKVNRSLVGEIGREHYAAMSAVVDPRNSLVIWAVANATPSSKLYIYNYALDRWSTATQLNRGLFLGLSEGVTLDGLNAFYGSLEAVPGSLDDDIWKGGQPSLYVFNSANVLGTFGGGPKAATFKTGELPIAGGRRARMRRVRLLADVSAGVSVEIEGAARRGDPVQRKTFSGVNRFGDVPVRAVWQYPAMTLRIAGERQWSEATGFEVEFEGGGK